MGNAYYAAAAKDFLIDFEKDALLSKVNRKNEFDVNKRQEDAWEIEFSLIRNFIKLDKKYEENCEVVLEYAIPELAKRVDAVLLYKGIVFVLEFKINCSSEDGRQYDSTARRQVLGYCLDLKYFHEESIKRPIVPVLICTGAADYKNDFKMMHAGVMSILCCHDAQGLKKIVDTVLDYGYRANEISARSWDSSATRPVPTIINAARSLWAGHGVEEISRTASGRDKANIRATTQKIIETIKCAARSSSAERPERVICLVTGEPGAGKTLIGLNVAITAMRDNSLINDGAGKFLSGNGPLVDVLQTALARDARQTKKVVFKSLKFEGRKFCDLPKPIQEYFEHAIGKTFVLDAYDFRNAYLKAGHNRRPGAHVVVFDEAQRAWSRKQMIRKIKNWNGVVKQSEPSCLLEQMSSRSDWWACVVCLIGNRQEIHDGEAGVKAWLTALANDVRFASWRVCVSDELYRHPENFELSINPDDAESGQESSIKDCLLALKTKGRLKIDAAFHLKVSHRSFRNGRLADLVDAIVSGDVCRARKLVTKKMLQKYPFWVTRNLKKAEDWVRRISLHDDEKLSPERYGILASSTEQRIRAEGVYVPKSLNVSKWMLGESSDVDSSYAMELAASEFKVQGLEIDYSIVVWGGDYCFVSDVSKLSGKDRNQLLGNFKCYGYSGGKRTKCTQQIAKEYLRNAYRVLLTRARQGMVIYVPESSSKDLTRSEKLYKGTYNFLTSFLPTEPPETINL